MVENTTAGLLFAVVLAVLLVVPGPDRGLPYRGLEHDGVSARHLAVATNLSPAHGFLQFQRWYGDADGAPAYEPYHRFSPLGYVLIRLATSPFGDDNLSGRLYAARLLMLGFFAGAAALAYLSLCRLTGRRAAALAATLLAFSSYPLLYFSDLITTEGAMDLFAVLLAFHGFAIYVRPSGTRPRCGALALRRELPALPNNRREVEEAPIGQLVAKTCAALLLGWHVYALLLPLLLLAVPQAVGTRDWRRFRHCVLLGVAAVLTGLAVLAFNFVREHHAMGGSFLDLPSVRSMLRRTGVAPVGDYGWGRVIHDQFRRIGEAALPWALAEPLQWRLYERWHLIGWACMGLAALLVCLPGTRHRIAWSGLALCGMGWALPMRYQVQLHEFEALFHVGVPLVAGALALERLQRFAGRWRRRADRPAAVAIVAAAVALFGTSAWSMGRVGDDAETRRRDRALFADMEEIRRHTRGKTLHVPRMGLAKNPCCSLFQLAGRAWSHEATPLADFVVDADLPPANPNRLAGAESPARRSLTPGNQLVFLYEPSAYRAALTAARMSYERLARTSEPVVAADSTVHLVGDALLYVREEEPSAAPSAGTAREPAAREGEFSSCRTAWRTATFFLHVYPMDLHDLPEQRRHEGFANLHVTRGPHWRRDGRCFALAFLPTFRGGRGGRDGPIGEIHTGLWRVPNQPVWEGRFSPRQARGRDSGAHAVEAYERVAAGELLARSVWDVHFLHASRELGFVKTPCAAADTAGRFFLHLAPAAPEALHPSRRHLGFDNRDFGFRERGGELFDDGCVVYTRLPAYDIDTVKAGQYEPSAGVLWTVEFPLPRTVVQVVRGDARAGGGPRWTPWR